MITLSAHGQAAHCICVHACALFCASCMARIIRLPTLVASSNRGAKNANRSARPDDGLGYVWTGSASADRSRMRRCRADRRRYLPCDGSGPVRSASNPCHYTARSLPGQPFSCADSPVRPHTEPTSTNRSRLRMRTTIARCSNAADIADPLQGQVGPEAVLHALGPSSFASLLGSCTSCCGQHIGLPYTPTFPTGRGPS